MRYSKIPFPSEKYIPCRGIHPKKKKREPYFAIIMSDVKSFQIKNWNKSEAYLYAIDLFNNNYWWETHELLEEIWILLGKKTSEGKFIQGIIQISAALLKKEKASIKTIDLILAKAFTNLAGSPEIFIGINVRQLNDDVKSYFFKNNPLPPKIKLTANNISL